MNRKWPGASAARTADPLGAGIFIGYRDEKEGRMRERLKALSKLIFSEPEPITPFSHCLFHSLLVHPHLDRRNPDLHGWRACYYT